MSTKKHIGTISGNELFAHRKNKLSRHEGIVKSVTGYHRDERKYNRKGKKNQQLKNQLKDYGSKAAIVLC